MLPRRWEKRANQVGCVARRGVRVALAAGLVGPGAPPPLGGLSGVGAVARHEDGDRHEYEDDDDHDKLLSKRLARCH
jgi:hypothetical protein